MKWFAVQVKSTHENRVASLLEYQAFECFLPTFSSRRRWSDRIKRVEIPLFPGYVFSRFAISGRLPILKTPSVIGIVGIGATPTPIDDQEIANIQQVLKFGFGLSPHPFLQVGQRVRVNNGCLSGLEGIIADVRKRDQLILSVTLLQRSVAVAIDSAWVTSLHASKSESKLPSNGGSFQPSQFHHSEVVRQDSRRLP
jgi:transcription antitermination factor NusG